MNIAQKIHRGSIASKIHPGIAISMKDKIQRAGVLGKKEHLPGSRPFMPRTSISERIARRKWERKFLELENKYSRFQQVAQKEKGEAAKAPKPKETPAAPAVAKVEPNAPGLETTQKKQPVPRAPKPQAPKKEKETKIVREITHYTLWNPEIPFGGNEKLHDIIRPVRDFLEWAFSAKMKKPFAVHVTCYLMKTQFTFTKNNFEKKPFKPTKWRKKAQPAAAVTPMYSFSLYLDDGKYMLHGSGGGNVHDILPEIDRLIIRHEKSM